MNGAVHSRTPMSGRQSLFFQDLETPVSTREGKFSIPGQAYLSENVGALDLPPPPAFTLEDRNDFSPEPCIPEYAMWGSPEANSDPRTPIHGFSRGFSTPSRVKSETTASYTLSSGNRLQTQSITGSASRGTPAMTSGALNSQKQGQTEKTYGKMNGWSPIVAAHGADEKEQVSPINGVVEGRALLTLPLPREVARPEIQRNSLPAVNLDEEEWVTIYGFHPSDTNLVLREFEKCGIILRHAPGPSNANWMHILYQSRSDAQKALNKNGIQINGVLIIGVKPVDLVQRQYLDERSKNQGFLPLPPATCQTVDLVPHRSSSDLSSIPFCNAGSRRSGNAIASPAKSMVSKITDLMFGV